MSNPDFRAEVVRTEKTDFFKCYHNPEIDQAQIMAVTPQKAEIMIEVLKKYLERA